MDGSRAGFIQGQNEPGFLHHNKALNKRWEQGRQAEAIPSGDVWGELNNKINND